MINHKELEIAGFERHGNWWTKGNVSVNLLGNTLFHTGFPKFQIADYNKDIALDDILNFSTIMSKLTGR